MGKDMILILDFGGSQSQSVARKIRGEKVYCEVLPYDTPEAVIREKAPKGIVLAGGSGEANAPEAADCVREVYEMGVPMLAIGYGSRRMLTHLGGRAMGAVLEKRTLQVTFDDSPLFEGLTESERFIARLDALEMPEGVCAIAHGNGLTAAFACDERRMYGMQFNAEQNDPDGLMILSNFANICECERWWSMETFVEQALSRIGDQVNGGSALMAISGGVDSSVCAVLMHRAIGRQMHCLYVDTGLMRKGETELVRKIFQEQMGMDITVVDAHQRFLDRLKGVSDPEQKRKIIGEEFVRVFEDEAKKLGQVDYLVQGTIYPDVIESYGVGGTMIKSHHNVGGLPKNMDFKGLVEPVRELFKDEVRQVGEVLGMPKETIYRQPFPGPGLAVRCIGEINEYKLNILREADAIFREEIVAAGLDRRIWQYFAVLTDMRSTGVRSDKRSYDYTVALRAINSVDAMSATAFRMPYDLLERVVARITSEVDGVNRVVYDITGKPPATIEWE